MKQALLFLPDSSVRDIEGVNKGKAVYEIYTYGRHEAAWNGFYEGKPGTYGVISGSETQINSTIARMASGLYFAHLVQYLT